MKASDSTPMQSVDLSQDLVQAMWIAMHDDDDIADFMLNMFVYNGLVDFIATHDKYHWADRPFDRMMKHLGQAFRRLEEGRDEMKKRWYAYVDVPF